MTAAPQELEPADWTGFELADRRYQVTHLIGQGGMASVYHACDRRLRTEVVIKVPHQRMLAIPEFAGRFTREVRALCEVSHPHIVHVLDVGQLGDMPFAVLQYLPGGSLEDRLRPDGAFGGAAAHDEAGWLAADVQSVTGWATQIASALDYLHKKNVVHRDVKPANILFDDSGNPYLSDFGVVKVLGDLASQQAGESLTSYGSVLGTLRFMAPEVLAGLSFDGRADQFALAVSAYLALTGRYPYDGASPVAMLYQQSTNRPRPLHEARAGLPAAASPVLLKALHHDPRERYATCVEFATELQRALENPYRVAPRAAEPDRTPLTARVAVKNSLRRIRHELRLILAAHGAEIKQETDDALLATLPVRQGWLQRWWAPTEPVSIRANLLPDDRDPRQAAEVSLHIACEGRALTDDERRTGRDLIDEVEELISIEATKSHAAATASETAKAVETAKSNEDSVSNGSGSTLARAADIVDVHIVGQDLGFVCRVAKVGPQGVWLIAGSEIAVGAVDVSFSPQAPRQRGRVVRTMRRNDGTYAIGVAFPEPIDVPSRLLKLLKA